jgi:hypothetical protein
MRFARCFRVASPLCILHQRRALERTATAGELLAPIERSKLDRLATDLVQHRHRGGDPEVMTLVRSTVRSMEFFAREVIPEFG